MNLMLSILTIVVVLIITYLIYKFIYKPKQINKIKLITDPVKNNLKALSQVEVDVKSKENKNSAYKSENTKVIEVYDSIDSATKQENELNKIFPFVAMTTLATDNENTLPEVKEENMYPVELNTNLPVEIPVQIATETPVEIIVGHSTTANVNNELVVQDNTVDLTTYQPSPSSAPSYESPSYTDNYYKYSSNSDYSSSSSYNSSDSYSSSDSSSSSFNY